MKKLLCMLLVCLLLLTACTPAANDPPNGDDSTTGADTMSQAEIDALLESSVHVCKDGPYYGYIDFDSQIAYQTWIEHVDVAEFEGQKQIGYCYYWDIDKWILSMRDRDLPTCYNGDMAWGNLLVMTLYGRSNDSDQCRLSKVLQDSDGTRVKVIYWLLSPEQVAALAENFESAAPNIKPFTIEDATYLTLHLANAEYPAAVKSYYSEGYKRFETSVALFLEQEGLAISFYFEKREWSTEQVQDYFASITLR